MLILISPAKTLDFQTTPRTTEYSQPILLKQARKLVKILKPFTPAKISELMGISDKLGVLNSTRYQQWKPPFTSQNAKQAALAFKGDVYQGLDAETLTEQDDAFAQQHLRILSGLYGLLKPLDLIQPYRLEMGTSLQNPMGKNLYQFWGEQITKQLNKELAEQTNQSLINLASNEYFKSVKPEQLQGQIITPVFKDFKNGKYKIISFYAKKARGLMARYIIQQRLQTPAGIKDFDLAGYAFDEAGSTATEWLFTRKETI